MIYDFLLSTFHFRLITPQSQLKLLTRVINQSQNTCGCIPSPEMQHWFNKQWTIVGNGTIMPTTRVTLLPTSSGHQMPPFEDKYNRHGCNIMHVVFSQQVPGWPRPDSTSIHDEIFPKKLVLLILNDPKSVLMRKSLNFDRINYSSNIIWSPLKASKICPAFSLTKLIIFIWLMVVFIQKHVHDLFKGDAW